MKRLMLDVNVVLDVLLGRQPHVLASSKIWKAVEGGLVQGFIPAHGVTTIYYLLERDRGSRLARRVVEKVLQVVKVAPVDDGVIREALSRGGKDFEDAVCAVAAEASKCEFIVTRDARGFPRSTIPAVDPQTAGALLFGT